MDTRYVRPRQHGRLRPVFRRELNQLTRLAKQYTGLDESEFHRGLAGGLRGFGHGVPGDHSTDATQVYLALVVWWRFVARLDSVTQLHRWLGHALSLARAGEAQRVSAEWFARGYSRSALCRNGRRRHERSLHGGAMPAASVQAFQRDEMVGDRAAEQAKPSRAVSRERPAMRTGPQGAKRPEPQAGAKRSGIRRPAARPKAERRPRSCGD